MAQMASGTDPGAIPRPIHLGFVVDKVALGQTRFTPVNNIAPMLNPHSLNVSCCKYKTLQTDGVLQQHTRTSDYEI